MGAGWGRSLDSISVRPWPASSISATAHRVDEVSMTKITDRPDAAAVTAEMLEVDERSTVDLKTLSPLDDNRASAGQLLESEVRELPAVLDPAPVHVRKLRAPPREAHAPAA